MYRASRFWLPRVSAAAGAALLAWTAVVAADVASAGPGARIAALAASIGGILLGALSLAPTRLWDAITSCLKTGIERLQAPPVTVPARSAAVIMGIGALGFAAIVARLLTVGQNPWDDDQGAFLITAREINARGGPLWLWQALFSGEFAEANRHPLYLALLSLRPTFAAGQALSLLLGAGTLAVLTGMTARRYGRATAAVFCVLLATNGAFCLFSTRVVCEVLLVLFCGVAWLIHVPRGAPNVAAGATGDLVAAARPSFPMRETLAGAFLGLAWLTKGTGLVLFAGYLLWILVPQRIWTAGRNSPSVPTVASKAAALRSVGLRLVCAAAAFAAVGLPLMARNVTRFGNPFYNLNSLLLFAERYEDLTEMQRRGVTTGVAAREFLERHSIGEIVSREAVGLVWEAFIVLRGFGPAPLDDARVAFGLVWALLAAGRIIAGRDPAGGLVVVWTALSWVVFAWYVPIAAGERFILPLVAPLMILAADGFVRLASHRGMSASRWLPAVAGAWVLLWAAASWASTEYAARSS